MKEYRKEELRSYVIGNIIFIITLSGIFDSVLSKSIADLMDVIHLIFESALLSSILYIYIYIIDSLVPPSLKDKISFFPINKPGRVVFEKIRSNKLGYRDDRFTIDDVKKKYEEIYKEIDKMTRLVDRERDNKKRKELKKKLKIYQNSKWFGIYMQQKDDNAVSATHKDSLLNRDMNVITVSILVFYLIICFFTPIIQFRSSVVILLAVEFVATGIAAKSRAIRFVLTVISRDIYKR